MARNSVVVKVEGLAELGRNFAVFSAEVKKKLLRKATKEAANVVRDQAKRNFVAKWKRGDEPLHVVDAIASKRQSKASRPEGNEVFAVGVFKIGKSAKTGAAYKYANTRRNRSASRVNKEYKVDPPEFYWKFLEFGTVRGIRAGPFLAPAFDQKKSGSQVVMERELRVGMEKITRKLIKPPRSRKV